MFDQSERQPENGTRERYLDVTQKLRELAHRDQRFCLRNNTFGMDPHPGRPKTLRIFARGPQGQIRTFEYPDGDWVDGAQFSGWGIGNWGEDPGNGGWNETPPPVGGSGGSIGHGLLILRAEYSAGRQTINITDRLQQRVVDGRLRVKVNDKLAGGDPAVGRPKQLVVSYRVNGQERRRVVNQGDYLNLP